MRMWLVNPKILCRKHLMGEHVEMHMTVGTLIKRISVAGYLKNNLLEPMLLYERHEELAQEIIRRGMKHNSPMNKSEVEILLSQLSEEHRNWKIRRDDAADDLITRCLECNVNAYNLSQEEENEN